MCGPSGTVPARDRPRAARRSPGPQGSSGSGSVVARCSAAVAARPVSMPVVTVTRSPHRTAHAVAARASRETAELDQLDSSMIPKLGRWRLFTRRGRREVRARGASGAVVDSHPAAVLRIRHGGSLPYRSHSGSVWREATHRGTSDTGPGCGSLPRVARHEPRRHRGALPPTVLGGRPRCACLLLRPSRRDSPGHS
jgi:hypothetical protein